MKNKFTCSKILVNAEMILISVCSLIPFLIMISVSISNESIITNEGFSIIPKTIDFTAYKLLFSDFSVIGRSIIFTLIIAVLKPLLGCLIQSLLGFSLAQDDYDWKGPIMFLIVFSMLFNAGTIPTYILYTTGYKLSNTPMVFFLTGLVSAWDIILYKTFFKSIPRALIESARVDGVNQLQIMWYIVLPMSKAIFAIQYFTHLIGMWNNFGTSLLYITDQKYMLIQHILQRILENAKLLQQAYSMAGIEGKEIPIMTMRYAICIIAIIPVFAIFPYVQKFFSKGIAVGSVKG